MEGGTYSAGGCRYKVIKRASGKAGKVMLASAADRKKITVPASVKLPDGRKYSVVSIGTKAFGKSKALTVTVGKNVSSIRKRAFAGSKVRTLILKTKKLKKQKVKGCLKGSKVKKIRVKAGSASVNRKYLRKYRKIFTKKNAGRKCRI